MKIKITQNVRNLLAELVAAVERFDIIQQQLSGNCLATKSAIDLGSAREHQKVVMLGVANRLANACRK